MRGGMVLLICMFLGGFSFAQEEKPKKKKVLGLQGSLQKARKDSVKNIFALRPMIGFGVGTLSYFGEINNHNKGFHPTIGRWGYHLNISTKVNDEINVELHTTFGKIGASERGDRRNLNFESTIRTGGFFFGYNFNNLLPKKYALKPYFKIGFESFEFLSKTDLFDAKGNKYHYWSDGTIRDIDESSSNAVNAVEITRDYVYETDLRELNLDGFGKYPERAFATPVSLGFNFKINDKTNLQIGSTMHYAFTDLIDNVSGDSFGTRKGDPKNDRFLFTGFQLNYDFTVGTKNKKIKLENITEEHLTYDGEDQDKDGIIDFHDLCPDTPEGLDVDENGCPEDSDGDGYYDYQDREINSPNAIVDEFGVSLSDAEIQRRYANFMDFTDISQPKIIKSRAVSSGNPIMHRSRRTYVVTIGSDQETIAPNMIATFLSMPNVTTVESNDTTYYIVGDYDNVDAALRQKASLMKQGLDARVIAAENGEIKTVESQEVDLENVEIIDSDEIVIRVQIGAFKRDIPKNLFGKVSNLFVLKGKDGLNHYVSGSYSTIEEAAKHKVNLLFNGFEGAFLVAYKRGKRISLKEAGATSNSPGNDSAIEEKNPIVKETQNAFKKEKVKFGIQVGAYSEEVSSEQLTILLEMGVKQIQEGKVTKYIYGDFTTLDQAQRAKKKLIDKYSIDAFIIGMFNNKVIPVSEATTILEN